MLGTLSRGVGEIVRPRKQKPSESEETGKTGSEAIPCGAAWGAVSLWGSAAGCWSAIESRLCPSTDSLSGTLATARHDSATRKETACEWRARASRYEAHMLHSPPAGTTFSCWRSAANKHIREYPHVPCLHEPSGRGGNLAIYIQVSATTTTRCCVFFGIPFYLPYPLLIESNIRQHV